MCGIFGAVGLGVSDLPEGWLDRVSASIAHRGPDAQGRWQKGDCALLHRRLRIIDLSENAAQPMPNEDGSVQVVFNGEIYNHRQLRAELESAGHHFRSRSDTEVIVHGYELWGDHVVERLDGMFAFALWDARRHRMLCARDRSGKKPVFFSEVGGIFRVGSEVKALHASGLPTGMKLESLPHEVRQYMKGFIDEIPIEYEEAALIDGYTRFQAFTKVVLPQAATGIASTAIFCLIFAWNEYAFAVLLTSGTAQTAPPFIPTIIGTGGKDWPAVAAGATLFLLPIMIFTILLRKHLLRGITFGAVRK